MTEHATAKRNRRGPITEEARDVIARIPDSINPDDVQDLRTATLSAIFLREELTITRWYRHGVVALGRSATFYVHPHGGLVLKPTEWVSVAACGVPVPHDDLYYVNHAVKDHLGTPGEDGSYRPALHTRPPIPDQDTYLYIPWVTDDRFLPRHADQDVLRTARFVSRVLRGEVSPVFTPVDIGTVDRLFTVAALRLVAPRPTGLPFTPRPLPIPAYYTDVRSAGKGEVWVSAAIRIGPVLLLVKTRWRLNPARKLVRVRHDTEFTLAIPPGKDPAKVRSAILSILSRDAAHPGIVQAAMQAPPGPFPCSGGTMRTLPHVYHIHTPTRILPEDIPALTQAAREAETWVAQKAEELDRRERRKRTRTYKPPRTNPIFTQYPVQAMSVARVLGAIPDRTTNRDALLADLIRAATENRPISVQVRELAYSYNPNRHEGEMQNVRGGRAIAITRLGHLHLFVNVEVDIRGDRVDVHIGRAKSPRDLTRFTVTHWTAFLVYHHRPLDDADRAKWRERMGKVVDALAVAWEDTPRWCYHNQVLNLEDIEPHRRDAVVVYEPSLTAAFSKRAPGFVRTAIGLCRKAIWEAAREEYLTRAYAAGAR